MAILVEANVIVVKIEAIESRFPGGSITFRVSGYGSFIGGGREL